MKEVTASTRSTLTEQEYAEVEARLRALGVPADRLDEQMERWGALASSSGRKLTASFVDRLGVAEKPPILVNIWPSTLHRCHVATARARTVTLVRTDEPGMVMLALGMARLGGVR